MTLVQLLRQSDNNLQRMYHIINAGNNFGDDISQKINKVLKVENKLDISSVDLKKSMNEIFVPPGRVFYMYKKEVKDKHFVMEEAER